MKELLSQQELHFRPLSGHFDVEQIGAAVLAIEHALRDEFVPSLFLMFLDAEDRERHRAARHADPRAPLPYVLLIDVKPDALSVNQFAGPEHDGQTRPFLAWLARHHPRCEVRNEEGSDLGAAWQAVVDRA